METEKNGLRCWNGGGIWGDCSCPRLARVVHCVKCPVYSAAAGELFERPIPADYFDEWAGAFEHRSESLSDGAGGRVFLFSICGRLFALPSKSVSAVVSMRMIHRIPHRRDPALLGLANINGDLVPSFDLAKLFSVPVSEERRRCIIVCSDGGGKFAFAAESAKGAVSPDSGTAAAADVSDPWYVGGKFKFGGVDAVLIDYEILIGAITKKHL